MNFLDKLIYCQKAKTLPGGLLAVKTATARFMYDLMYTIFSKTVLKHVSIRFLAVRNG